MNQHSIPNGHNPPPLRPHRWRAARRPSAQSRSGRRAGTDRSLPSLSFTHGPRSPLRIRRACVCRWSGALGSATHSQKISDFFPSLAGPKRAEGHHPPLLPPPPYSGRGVPTPPGLGRSDETDLLVRRKWRLLNRMEDMAYRRGRGGGRVDRFKGCAGGNSPSNSNEYPHFPSTA